VIAARIPALNSGTLFPNAIVVDIAIQIFGVCTKQSSQKSNIQQQLRKQEPQLMWSAGIIYYDKVLVDSFAKCFLSPNV